MSDIPKFDRLDKKDQFLAENAKAKIELDSIYKVINEALNSIKNDNENIKDKDKLSYEINQKLDNYESFVKEVINHKYIDDLDLIKLIQINALIASYKSFFYNISTSGEITPEKIKIIYLKISKFESSLNQILYGNTIQNKTKI